MYKLIAASAIAFFIFIAWIIYLANTGSQSIFFEFVAKLPYGDKLGHFGLFGTLTFIAVIGSKFRHFSLGRFNFYIASTLIAIFALIEEFSQAFIPSRSFDLVDLLADFLGILISTGLAHLVSKRLLKAQVKSQ